MITSGHPRLARARLSPADNHPLCVREAGAYPRLMRDAFRAPIKAAGAAAFIVGLLLFLLHPPSLSGAEGLAALIGGAVAVIVGTAWATVALTGREAMSEREFERLVRRSEALAREPTAPPAPSDFDVLVADAIDRLPEEFQRLLERTPVVVSHRGAEHRAYGRYYGDTVARENYEDRIVIYQDTLERDFGHDSELLRGQVERTLRHELAHHLGWRERGVQDLGL
jgi:predicted Zn-dependent protease with MMP-like domain